METTAFVEMHLCKGSFACVGYHSERGNNLFLNVVFRILAIGSWVEEFEEAVGK